MKPQLTPEQHDCIKKAMMGPLYAMFIMIAYYIGTEKVGLFDWTWWVMILLCQITIWTTALGKLLAYIMKSMGYWKVTEEEE